MRVMVWADIEGVAGVTSWEHTGGRTPLYEEGRRLYTEEINAIVRACRRAKVDEIIVVDGHGGGYEGARAFMSLIPDRLEQGARYVLGHAWARYVEPLTQECDAVLFVGAHAKAGTPGGVLSHTVSSEAWYLATINGTPVGESGIVAAIAGSWNVPAVFVAGDEATCTEVRELIGPTVVTAPVKKGLGRFSAVHLAPVDARTLIETRAADALGIARGGRSHSHFRLRSPSRWSWPLPIDSRHSKAAPASSWSGRARSGRPGRPSGRPGTPSGTGTEGEPSGGIERVGSNIRTHLTSHLSKERVRAGYGHPGPSPGAEGVSPG